MEFDDIVNANFTLKPTSQYFSALPGFKNTPARHEIYKNGSFPWNPLTSLNKSCVPQPGPCSQLPIIYIPVVTKADFVKRLLYSSGQMVILQLQVNLTGPIVFNASYRCTRIEPYGIGPAVLQSDPSNLDSPVLVIQNVSYFTVSSITVISANLPVDPNANRTACPLFISQLSSSVLYTPAVCPAIVVLGDMNSQLSTNVALKNLQVNGNILIDATSNFTLGSVNVTSQDLTGFAVTIGRSTLSLLNYTMSNSIIANSEIIGGYGGIFIYQTVGLTVSNNYIHDFVWFGIQCGQSPVDVPIFTTCVLATISKNVIDRGFYDGNYVSTLPMPTLKPSACISIQSFWADFGNTMTGNYFFHCGYSIWLDDTTSFVTITSNLAFNDRSGFLRIGAGSLITVSQNVVAHTNGSIASVAIIEADPIVPVFDCTSNTTINFINSAFPQLSGSPSSTFTNTVLNRCLKTRSCVPGVSYYNCSLKPRNNVFSSNVVLTSTMVAAQSVMVRSSSAPLNISSFLGSSFMNGSLISNQDLSYGLTLSFCVYFSDVKLGSRILLSDHPDHDSKYQQYHTQF